MNKASRCVVVKRRGFLTRKSQKKLVCFRRSNSAYARIYARLKNWCFRDNKPPHCKPKKKQRDFSHLFLSSLFSLSFCSSSVFALFFLFFFFFESLSLSFFGASLVSPSTTTRQKNKRRTRWKSTMEEPN